MLVCGIAHEACNPPPVQVAAANAKQLKAKVFKMLHSWPEVQGCLRGLCWKRNSVGGCGWNREKKRTATEDFAQLQKGRTRNSHTKEQDLNESEELWEQRGIITINTAEVNGGLQFSEDSGSSYVRVNPDNIEKKIKPQTSRVKGCLC